MNITRDLIIDLLPLYVAGEASSDTRAAVELFATKDAAVRALLEALKKEASVTYDAVPPSLEREAVNRTRSAIRHRSWTMGFALWFTLMPLTIAGGAAGVTFLLIRDLPALGWASWLGATLLWLHYVRLGRRLRTSGL